MQVQVEAKKWRNHKSRGEKMEQRSIFRKESLDRMASPERLDEYIKVVKPSLWIVVLAAVLLVASLIVWGFTGTIPKTLNMRGYIDGKGEAICYVPTNSMGADLEGNFVTISLPDGQKIKGVVSKVSATPYSLKEIAERVQNDWIVNSVMQGEYAYELHIQPEETMAGFSNVLIGATVIVSEIKPIQMMLE